MGRQVRWRAIGAVALAVAAAALGSRCAADIQSPTPVQSRPDEVAPGPPASISLSAVSGVGSSAGTAFVSVVVLDRAGKRVPHVDVALDTSTGTITPAFVTTDDVGGGQATLSANRDAVVTARTGEVAATTRVTANAPPPPTTPTPQPPPPSSTPAPRITLVISPATAQPGASVVLAANSVDTSFAPTQFSWTFGDGASESTTTRTTTHIYTSNNNYLAGVTATDAAGRSATATQGVSIFPLTPTLQVAVSCAPEVVFVVGNDVTCTATVRQNGTDITQYVHSYRFTFMNGTGTTATVANVVTTQGPTARYGFHTSGDKTVTVLATGDDLQFGRGSATFTMQ